MKFFIIFPLYKEDLYMKTLQTIIHTYLYLSNLYLSNIILFYLSYFFFFKFPGLSFPNDEFRVSYYNALLKKNPIRQRYVFFRIFSAR